VRLELNGGTALAAGKRSTAGVAHRLELVRRAFPDAEAQLAAVTWPRKIVELSDLLDAYAALATAVRCARGEHTTLGDGERDEAGVIMRMAI
jgi:predicted RNase H-like nuclease